jgi:hypothetical protein
MHRDSLQAGPPAESSSSPDFFEVLAAIHQSGIDLVITASSFWDGGCEVRVRDARCDFNTTRKFERLGEAGIWLIGIVRDRYPTAAIDTSLQDKRPSLPISEAADGKTVDWLEQVSQRDYED